MIKRLFACVLLLFVLGFGILISAQADVSVSFVNLPEAVGSKGEATQNDEMWELYNFLKICVKEVASGTRTSTQFAIEKTFNLDQEAYQNIFNALNTNNSYELFWYDRNVSIELAIEDGCTVVSFAVRDDYSEDAYTTNPAAIESALEVIGNCQSIIGQYQNASDYEKLKGYKDWICDHVKYNDEAAHNIGNYDQDAWQIIWVFDNDDNTNVVCEGYAKAFQYLCDHSSFSEEVVCHTVTGYLDGGGRHMWNLVSFDGQNYIVDLTECDTLDEKIFFLAGAQPTSNEKGYYVRTLYAGGYKDTTYSYDEATLWLYSESAIPVTQNRYRSDNIVYCEAFEPSYETDIGYPGSARVNIQWIEGEVYYQWYRNTTFKTDEAPVYEIVEGANSQLFESDPCYEPRLYECIVIDDFGNQRAVFVEFWIYNDLTVEITEGNEIIVDQGSSVTLSVQASCLVGEISYQWHIADYNNPIWEIQPEFVAELPLIPEGTDPIIVVDNVQESAWYYCCVADDFGNMKYASIYVICSTDVQTEGTCGENATWLLTETGELIISGSGKLASYGFDYERPWHSIRDRIVSARVEEGITDLVAILFMDCKNLETVYLPDSLQQLGFSTFIGCSSLKNINIPEGITTIPVGCFWECTSLEEVIIPDSVTKIEILAFYDSGIKTIHLPDNCIEIGPSAFQSCKNLETIELPNGMTIIESDAFNVCTSLKTVSLPDSITMIGERAFSGCRSLEAVVLPQNLIEIGRSAFNGCSSLIELIVPDSVISLGIGFVGSCTSLRNVVLPSMLTEISDYSFELCSSLTSIIIPDSVSTIGEYAFKRCSSLTEITLPETVTSIGRDAFHGCSALEQMILPPMLTEISAYSFTDCSSLRSIMIPDSVTKIGDAAFSRCSKLADITFPKNLTSIGSFAFQGCVFVELSFPENLASIGPEAFIECKCLKTVDMKTQVKELSEEMFRECESLEEIILPQSLEVIGEKAFFNCISLENVNLPESLKIISNDAFHNCINLHSVTLPAKMTYLGAAAFASTGINSIIIPGSISSIQRYVFASCKNLTWIIINQGVESIEEGVFRECNNLRNVYYAGTEEEWAGISIADSNNPLICANIHYNFLKNNVLTLPANLTTIESEAFNDLPNTGGVRIPATVISIADGAIDEDIIIIAPAGSYAITWAREQEYAFVEE